MLKMGITTISSNILKKTVAAFLVLAIMFNVVIPKIQELKNNFTEALSCAVIAQTHFVDKYADSVIKVTNSMAINLLIALNKLGLYEENINKTEESSNKAEQSKPVNTSAENGIVAGSNTNSQNEINILKVKTADVLYYFGNSLDVTYTILKANSYGLTENIGILFFVLFSILIVRIKDTIAVLNNNVKNKPAWLI